jgi:hypothetical protein
MAAEAQSAPGSHIQGWMNDHELPGVKQAVQELCPGFEALATIWHREVR